MKRHVCMLMILACLLPACALAAPVLERVLPGDVSLVTGQEGWYVDLPPVRAVR